MMAWFVQGAYKDWDRGRYWSPGIVQIASDHARFDDVARKFAHELSEKYMAGDRNRDSADYPELSFGGLPYLHDGWRFPAFDAPLRDQLKRREDSVVDIISTSFGTYALSQRVIDIIESIEPGIHQFIPYEMLNPDGSVHPAKRWLLNICTRAEVINVERSNVVWMDFGGGRRKFGDITAGGRQPHIIMNAGEASRRAMWCEWRYHSGTVYIVSDRFWDAMQAEGIIGWGPHHSYLDHVEEI